MKECKDNIRYTLLVFSQIAWSVGIRVLVDMNQLAKGILIHCFILKVLYKIYPVLQY